LIGAIIGASAAAVLAVAAFAGFWFRRRALPPRMEHQSSSGDGREDPTILTYAETITRDETGVGLPSDLRSASALFEDLIPAEGFSLR
jgi:hypothetical protein